MTTLERAFEIARAGNARTVTDIRKQLNREGYELVQSHLNGSTVQKQLRALIAIARVQRDDGTS
ncbi:MAG: hypothetical protein EOO77_00960 [Oxalobacteraceae bacterium]|nr:MAG: hypothetical protein EOO77_00960 [Oxalobacteraceae bacterium]